MPDAPLISVVVPIYNVEPYLEACLDSIARQTLDDLEVIMVNDGSTDGSAEIAKRFEARDARFRLIEQPNGGLSRARNTGADAATGEFLSFVDSDDLIPLGAYELLVTALQKTGSDFATGNVHRLMQTGIAPTRFLARAFETTRLGTHVTKFRPLLADRIVPNKLWRRSFWEEHGYRFPEGMLHEDIPVVLPAQFAARSVDVIAEPVYLYRIREGADLSITQRRVDKKALLDRVKAVEMARDHLAKEGPRRAKRWYEESVVAEDLSYYLNVLDAASDEYRELFLERVNAFLDRTARGLFDHLLAIDRLKWHLVRRRLMPELLEVLRFHKENLEATPPVRVGRRWYGDYPFRTDPELRIPSDVYRLNRELVLTARVEDLRFAGDELRVGGYAYIAGIGAPTEETQRVTVTVVRRGRLRRIRMRTSAIRLSASVRHRPDATADADDTSVDVQWSGFEASLPVRRLRRRLGGWRPGTWDLYVTARAGGITRRRSRFAVRGPRPVRATDCVLRDGVMVRAAPAASGEIAMHVKDRWASVSRVAHAEGALELHGRLRFEARGGGLKLRLARTGSKRLEYPLAVDGQGFSVAIPLADLEAAVEAAHPEPHGPGVAWDLWVVADDGRERLALDTDVVEPVWPIDGRELTLLRTKDGDAALIAQDPRPVVLDARWTGDGGELELSGEVAPGARFDELVLVGRKRIERKVLALHVDGDRFEARLPLARVPSLAGELPLAADTWDVFVRSGGEPEDMVRLALTQTLDGRLPLRTTVRHKTLMLGSTPEQHAVVISTRDLGEDERGGFHQRRLRGTAWEARRGESLRNAVVYASFGGRQYSDSPRAIHEELVRRGAPLEHLWAVRDGRCHVPEDATVLRVGSADYYEALATARFVVTNGDFPNWFARRPDQVCVQTLRGMPLKRLGLDVPHLRGTVGRSLHSEQQVANWQHVLSPNRFATPVLRQAYGLENAELLETGLPRADVLTAPGADARRAEVRRRLGLSDGTRAVLYAPTYRDHVVDRRRRYRLDLRLNLQRLRAAAGVDTVLLFRKHPFVRDFVPEGLGGFVRDVSDYPDGVELLLAADVLVTDYSSLMFDFANTGRPMLFFTYDLDTYENDIRGFYLDFRAQAPGPLLATTEELAEALRELDGVPRQYAQRYRDFAATYCEFDDGGAAARVVERLFSA